MVETSISGNIKSVYSFFLCANLRLTSFFQGRDQRKTEQQSGLYSLKAEGKLKVKVPHEIEVIGFSFHSVGRRCRPHHLVVKDSPLLSKSYSLWQSIAAFPESKVDMFVHQTIRSIIQRSDPIAFIITNQTINQHAFKIYRTLTTQSYVYLLRNMSSYS